MLAVASNTMGVGAGAGSPEFGRMGGFCGVDGRRLRRLWHRG